MKGTGRILVSREEVREKGSMRKRAASLPSRLVRLRAEMKPLRLDSPHRVVDRSRVHPLEQLLREGRRTAREPPCMLLGVHNKHRHLVNVPVNQVGRSRAPGERDLLMYCAAELLTDHVLEIPQRQIQLQSERHDIR